MYPRFYPSPKVHCVVLSIIDTLVVRESCHDMYHEAQVRQHYGAEANLSGWKTRNPRTGFWEIFYPFPGAPELLVYLLQLQEMGRHNSPLSSRLQIRFYDQIPCNEARSIIYKLLEIAYHGDQSKVQACLPAEDCFYSLERYTKFDRKSLYAKVETPNAILVDSDRDIVAQETAFCTLFHTELTPADINVQRVGALHAAGNVMMMAGLLSRLLSGYDNLPQAWQVVQVDIKTGNLDLFDVAIKGRDILCGINPSLKFSLPGLAEDQEMKELTATEVGFNKMHLA